ncbi:MAG: endonuclease domain-containing protein, partial [Bacteroidales bacterium]|nr:endonuclease domain-containing protein [Bacteroidales bacterium]
RLVIELDGGIHSRQEIKVRDENRQAEIERFDLHVLRFKNKEVMEDVEGFGGGLISYSKHWG